MQCETGSTDRPFLYRLFCPSTIRFVAAYLFLGLCGPACLLGQQPRSIRMRVHGLKLVITPSTIRAFRGQTLKWEWAGDFEHTDRPIGMQDGRHLIVFGLRRSQFSVLTNEGKVVWSIPWHPLGDYVGHVQTNRNTVVYHYREGRDWQWKPGPAGDEVMAYKKGNWRLYARDRADGHVRWILREPEVYPVASTGKNELWTLSLRNPRAYYVLGKDAKYELQLRTFSTGKRIKAWPLPTLYRHNERWSTSARNLDSGEDRRNLVFRWDMTTSRVTSFSDKVMVTLAEVAPYSEGNTPDITGVLFKFVYHRSNRTLQAHLRGKRVL